MGIFYSEGPASIQHRATPLVEKQQEFRPEWTKELQKNR
jgi:hypothetical protein